MKRLYSVQYSPQAELDDVIAWADTSPHIENWRYELPGSIFVISSAAARDLADDFHRRLGEVRRVLVAEVGENFSGYMTPDFWRLLRDKPTHVPAG